MVTYDKRMGRAVTPAILQLKEGNLLPGLGIGERIIARCPLCGVEGEVRTGEVRGACQHYETIEYVEGGRLFVHWDFSKEVK